MRETLCKSTNEYLRLPANLWSDMDYVAYDVLRLIEETEYKVKTSLKNICVLVVLLMENNGYSMAETYEYVKQHGLQEFDYVY